MEGLHLADLQAAAHRVHKVVLIEVEGQHLIVRDRTGQHLIVPLQQDLHRVHKVVLIDQDQMRLAAEDPIELARRVQVFPSLRQTAAVVRSRHEPPWVVLVIPRVFVHELLNR